MTLRLRADDELAAPPASVETTTLAGDRVVEVTKLVYDAQGRLIEASQNGPPALYRYETIAPHRERVTVAVGDHVVREFERSTRDDGSVIEEASYGRDVQDIAVTLEGQMFRVAGAARATYRYRNERLESAEFHAHDDTPLGRIAVEKDAERRVTRVVQTIRGQTVTELRRSYDDARREVTVTVTAEGAPVVERRLTVDERGFVMAETMEFFGITRRIDYQYEVNERGDWIARAAFADGVPGARTLRTIEYR